MLNQQLSKEQRLLNAQIAAKAKSGDLKIVDPAPQAKRRRWDQPSAESNGDTNPVGVTPGTTPKRWDDSATPLRPGVTPSSTAPSGTRGQWEETPGRPKDNATTPGTIRRWAETPAYISSAATPGRDTSALGVCFNIFHIVEG